MCKAAKTIAVVANLLAPSIKLAAPDAPAPEKVDSAEVNGRPSI